MGGGAGGGSGEGVGQVHYDPPSQSLSVVVAESIGVKMKKKRNMR